MAILFYFSFFHVSKSAQEKEQHELEEVLMESAMTGDLRACQEAVEDEGAKLPSGPSFVDKPGRKTAVHQAAQYGHNEIVEWLVLDKDVPVDLPDFALMRPLHYAAMKGRTMTCKLLLSMKADPTTQDTAKYTCVHFAASGGDEETLEVLKKAGGDMNARDSGGFTPMMLAANKGKAAAVQWLLDNGGDKFAWNGNEATAYDLALKRGHKNVVSVLDGKPVHCIPQRMRQEAEEKIQKQQKSTSMHNVNMPAAATESALRQRGNKKEHDKEQKKEAKEEPKLTKEQAKKELEKAALDMAKNHVKKQQAEKSQEMAKKLKDAGIGNFKGTDFDARSIKENFPDAWERARQEVSGIGGGEDALNSLLDTVE